MVVKTNSKYKEDDCSDSNADVNSLDVCVHWIHRILFRHTTHPTCQISAQPSSRFTSQSAENTHEIHNSVSTLAPLWWWFRYGTNNRRHCLHLAPRSTKFQRSGRNQTSFHYPVYRISPQSLSLRLSLVVRKPAVKIDDLHHHHEVLQTPSNWYSSIVSLLISKTTNFNATWENISKPSFY